MKWTEGSYGWLLNVQDRWTDHVPVTPPAMNHTDYYNRKGWYSMLVQAVVDHELLFRNLCVGWPGSVHDARVLANSSVYKKISNGQLLEGSIVKF